MYVAERMTRNVEDSRTPCVTLKSVGFILGSEKTHGLKQKRELMTHLFKKGNCGSQWRGLRFLNSSGKENDARKLR